jgi:hypothetical protein
VFPYSPTAAEGHIICQRNAAHANTYLTPGEALGFDVHFNTAEEGLNPIPMFL